MVRNERGMVAKAPEWDYFNEPRSHNTPLSLAGEELRANALPYLEARLREEFMTLYHLLATEFFNDEVDDVLERIEAILDLEEGE